MGLIPKVHLIQLLPRNQKYYSLKMEQQYTENKINHSNCLSCSYTVIIYKYKNKKIHSILHIYDEQDLFNEL